MAIEQANKQAKAGAQVEAMTKRFQSAEAEMESIFSSLEQMLRDFPDQVDQDFLNQRITQGKNLLQAMINRH